MFCSLSASDVACFAVTQTVHVLLCYAFAQNMFLPTHQLSYAKHPFVCFGNSSISHAQMICQLGPGAFTLKTIGAAFPVSPGRFCIFVLTGVVYSEFCPFSLKIAPFDRGTFSTIGAFNRIITFVMLHESGIID